MLAMRAKTVSQALKSSGEHPGGRGGGVGVDCAATGAGTSICRAG